jgi:hypothetical protein
MTSCEFWLSALANLISTLIAGYIIYKAVERKISKKDTENQKRRLEIEKDIVKEKYAIKFLDIIKKEIEDILIRVENYKPSRRLDGHTTFMQINTDYWEILKTSGEIPFIFDPLLIQVLSIFYSTSREINKLDDRLALGRQSNNVIIYGELYSILIEKLNELTDMNSSNNLILCIDQGINKAKEKIKQLKQELNPLVG